MEQEERTKREGEMRAKEKESRSAILLTETFAQGQFQISARPKIS